MRKVTSVSLTSMSRLNLDIYRGSFPDEAFLGDQYLYETENDCDDVLSFPTFTLT